MYVANIRPVKGHLCLVKAFAQVVAQCPQAKLVLIGEDRQNGQIQNLVEGLGIINNVLFFGKREDARPLLKLADICVLSSLSEGMSNSILEYMAAGKAVVATDVGGNSELIEHNANGLLVAKESSEELAQGLLNVIYDEQKRKQMGENGLKRVKELFSMQRMVDHYENFFTELSPSGLKILHLISSSGLFGAENVLLSLAKNFNRRDVMAIVGAVGDESYSPIEVIEKAKEIGLPTFIVSSGRFDFGAVFRLTRYIKDEKITLLHTHNYKSDAIGFLAAKLSGIPIVATAHGFTDMTRAVRLYEHMDRLLLRLFFDRVVVVTDSVLRNFPDEKKRIIRNGLDINNFSRNDQQRSQLREKWGIKGNELLIATVGRLSIEKNQQMLIEAANQIVKKYSHIKFVIVGAGPEEENLKKQVDEFRLDKKVIFTGISKDVASVYQACDIFVLTSVTEGIPLTILEAMASYLPVVATRVGGVSELIEQDKTGLLVQSKSVADLIRKLEIVISDRTKAEELAKAGFNFVKENFTEEKMAKAYEQVYCEALLTSAK